MSSTVRTCGPDDDVASIMALMTDERIRHVPVVEAGRLCGIVSIGDVVKNRIDELGATAPSSWSTSPPAEHRSPHAGDGRHGGRAV